MGKAWVVADVLKSSGPPATIGKAKSTASCFACSKALGKHWRKSINTPSGIESEFDSTLAGVFRAHGEMLRSLFASGEFERELRASLLTAEAVVRRVLERWYQKFKSLENPVLRQRADDVLDVGRNIIRRLCPAQDAELQSIPEHSILVVERLLPSDVVRAAQGQRGRGGRRKPGARVARGAPGP